MEVMKSNPDRSSSFRSIVKVMHRTVHFHFFQRQSVHDQVSTLPLDDSKRHQLHLKRCSLSR